LRTATSSAQSRPMIRNRKAFVTVGNGVLVTGYGISGSNTSTPRKRRLIGRRELSFASSQTLLKVAISASSSSISNDWDSRLAEQLTTPSIRSNLRSAAQAVWLQQSPSTVSEADGAFNKSDTIIKRISEGAKMIITSTVPSPTSPISELLIMPFLRERVPIPCFDPEAGTWNTRRIEELIAILSLRVHGVQPCRCTSFLL